MSTTEETKATESTASNQSESIPEDEKNNNGSNKISFDDYHWEEDNEWQILIKKVEFPPNYSESQKERYLLKRKQKYFKEKIDSDFVPQKIKLSENKSYRYQHQSNDNEQSPKNENETETEKEKEKKEKNEENESKPSQSSQQSSQQSSSNHSHSSHSYHRQSYQQNPYGTYQPPPTQIGQILAPLLNYFYCIAQLFIFFSCLISILIPRPFYYYALIAVAITHLIAAIQNHGKPRMAAWYFQRILQDENIMIAINGAIFLMGNPKFIFLTPFALRAMFMSASITNNLLDAKIPSLHRKFLKPQLLPIIRKMGWFTSTIALVEVLMGFFLIFACFFMSRTVVLTLIYWQVMQMRYLSSATIQYAFRRVHIGIQGYLSKIPFLLNLYLKLANMLSAMVDQKRMQQQMGSSGAAQGISKYCTIM